MRAKPRLSIPTRVFLAFSVVLASFGALTGASLFQHQRTAETLRLLHGGYLPIALRISEARASQVVVSLLLDRPVEERGSAAIRFPLNLQLMQRPTTLRRVLAAVENAETLESPASERVALSEVRRELEHAISAVSAGDARFDELNAALLAHDDLRATAVLRDIREHERGIDRSLSRARDRLDQQIRAMSASIEEQERTSAGVLAISTAIAIVIGILLIWWTRRLLAPLPRLEERVAAVARGDLSRRIEPTSSDEIGRVAAEFERMVVALAARDASLREAADRLIRSERLAAVGRMATHVTHEVRNPLSSIGLNVELLEDEIGNSGPEAKDLLRAIHREIDRLTAVTEEYLRLARVPQPRLESEDLGEVVRDAARFLAPEMTESRIELVVSVEPKIPTVRIDEAQIRQALLNLLRNAREAMSDGGQIELAVARADGGVSLRVIDQGSGIPAEDRERIFDPFFTTKERGTGLGLSLTQQIVLAHGGRIRCDAAPGRGTVFELWFPEGSDPPTPEEHPPAAEGPAREAT